MKCHRCEANIEGGYCTLCMMAYQDLSAEQSKRIEWFEKDRQKLREALAKGINAIDLILKQEPEVEFKETLT